MKQKDSKSFPHIRLWKTFLSIKLVAISLSKTIDLIGVYGTISIWKWS